MSFESIPKELRHLRACLLCSMVKTLEQFQRDGCDNCERFLHLKADHEQTLSCTSSNFDGVVSMMNPDESWVAKWQRIDKLRPGCYAVSVSGRLPTSVVRELKSRGIPYRPRDTSSNAWVRNTFDRVVIRDCWTQE